QAPRFGVKAVEIDRDVRTDSRQLRNCKGGTEAGSAAMRSKPYRISSEDAPKGHIIRAGVRPLQALLRLTTTHQMSPCPVPPWSSPPLRSTHAPSTAPRRRSARLVRQRLRARTR